MSHKRTKTKKLFSATFLVISAYASILFAIGILAGYLLTRCFYKKYVENGLLKFMYIDFGGWKFHLHHWILGVLIIIFLLLGGWKSEFPNFLWGVICGIAVHDIYDFNDWHKVVSREKKTA